MSTANLSNVETNKKTLQAMERREQILAAALEVFSAKGYLGATNKEIAQAASMASAGLIYHYFEDKQDLLRQVIKRYHPVLAYLKEAQAELEANSTCELTGLRDTLLAFARQATQMLQSPQLLALMRVILGEAIHNAALSQTLFQMLPQTCLNYLQTVLVKHQKAGLLRDIPAHQLALQFLGAFIMQGVLIGIFSQDQAEQTIEPTTLVDSFLSGIVINPNKKPDIISNQ